MIKLTFCLKRKPGMSREDFQAYWRNHHAPLVKKHAEILGIQRYVQSHSLSDEYADALRASRAGSLEDAPEVYDGVAELWFESFDDLAGRAANPDVAAAGRALLEDEMKFIDLANSPLWYSEEHVVV